MILNRHLFRRGIRGVSFFIGFAAALALLIAGALHVWQTVRQTDREMRADLLARTRLMAEALNAERIGELSGTESDIGKPEYIRLKEQFIVLKQANDDLRFIYLMGRRPDGTIFFFVDNEPSGSSDYAPPGYVYSDISVPFRQAMDTWSEVVDGPLVDQWGVWVSALIPVRHPLTGEAVAGLGADIDARAWARALIRAALPGVVTTLLLVATVLTGMWLLARRRRLGAAAPGWMAHLEPVLVVGFGVTLSLFLSWHFYQRELRRCEDAFFQLAQAKTKGLADSIRLITIELHSLEKFIGSCEHVSNDEFNYYCKAFAENSVVWGWAWAPLVAADRIGEFEEHVRAEGLNGFQIWQPDAGGGRIPAAGRREYYPVLYLAPEPGKEPVPGFDLGSEPRRRAAVEDAIRTGLPTVAAPIELIFEKDGPQGIQLYRPVFNFIDGGRPIGVVVAAIRTDVLVRSYKRNQDIAHIELLLCRPNAPPEVLACGGVPPPSFGIPTLIRPIFAFGRVFAVTARPGAEFMAGYPVQALGIRVLLIGLAFTAAIALIVRLIFRRRAELECLVAARTDQLGESEGRFRRLAEQSRTVLWQVDERGMYTDVSEVADGVYGYTPAELIGKKHFYDLHPAEGREEFKAAAMNYFVTKQPFVDLINAIETKGGAGILVSTNGMPLFDHAGKFIGYHGSDKDVTERERMDAELKSSQAAALAASRAKSEFLTNMSHEIRTPINGVIGVTDLLRDTRLDGEQHHLVEIIGSSGKLLLSLINDILDFSRIEAGKAELHPVDFDLDELLGGLAGSLAFTAHAKNVELVLAVTPDVPSHLRGDRLRLQEVIMNLAGNAVKFTDHGEVAIEVAVERETADAVVVRFTVRDTGIGIEASQHPFLFDAFFQADSSVKRKHGGAGLGLPISKGLVERMGGQLRFSSEVGVGSEFSFAVPLGRPAAEAAVDPWPSDWRGARILVADDNATVRKALLRELASHALRPVGAADGEAALELLRQAQKTGDPFRAALIDWSIPGMAAAELAAAMRRDAGSAGIRLIALVPLGDRIEAGKLEDAGFGGMVNKPLNRKELPTALRGASATIPAKEEMPPMKRGGRPPPPEPEIGSSDILLAEDNPTNQQVALLMLKKLGLRADVAENGLEALQKLTEKSYRAVLMDVQMPELDGLEATRRIRDPGSPVRDHRIPVIAMTAHAVVGYEESCREAGMDDYIAKPVTPKKLREVLSRWLPLDPPPGA
jgi:PAS domain S-box-containing protein